MQKIVFYIFIIFGFFLLALTGEVNAQQCATIQRVSANVTAADSGKPFQCYVDVDNASAGSGNIACGISFDDGFPQNFCQSDIAFGGWQGNRAVFNCVIPDVNSITATKVELVGRDFVCNTPKTQTNSYTISLNKTANASGTPAPTGTGGSPSNAGSLSVDPASQLVRVREILAALYNGVSGNGSDQGNTGSGGGGGSGSGGTVSREGEALKDCPSITTRTSVEGPATITADQIAQVLRSFGASTELVNSAQTFYDLGTKYNINPAVMMAFFIKESSAGTAGASVENKNIGNIVCAGYPSCSGRWRRYATWAEGAEDYYKLIRSLYVDKWGLNYVESIVPIYAPSFENDTCQYIRQTTCRINTMSSGSTNLGKCYGA